MRIPDYIINAARQIDRAIRVRGPVHTLRLAARVLLSEGPRGVKRRLDALGPALRATPKPDRALILTMPHTLHFAQRLQAILSECGIPAELSDNDRGAHQAGLIIAIAPQNFPAAPPEKTIAFQVEQHIAPTRWTEAFLDRLAACRAVWDFSTANIAGLNARMALCGLYHVPFWPVAPTEGAARSGVLFYGDVTPPRRAALLAQIAKTVPELQVESNLFGPRMAERLQKTAIVLNLHARDDSLLETARISEALSQGCVVVSEPAPDQTEMPGLRFADGAEELATKLRALLDDRDALAALQAEAADPGPDRFRLGVLRALQGMGLIPPEDFERLATDYPQAVPQPVPLPRICLSLPETPARAEAFAADNPGRFRIWPGLKADPGWRGAALSYRYLFRELRARQIPEALIVEDDVALPPDFDQKLETIRKVMDDADADLFSGLSVDVHKDTRILDVERRDGMTFVHLDRAVMMICNLYRSRMIDYLADWDDRDDNAFTNTIDRYMERATHLRVVTTLPFLATYRGDLLSTLRDADNHSFDQLRARSEALLAEKLARFEAAR